jgi:hypothetical protein
VRDLGSLTVDDFAPLLHEHFRVDAGEGSAFDLELSEVTRSLASPAVGRRSRSSSRAARQPLPQRVHRVEHDRLGVLEIFFVPIPADRYEAVFT